MARVTKILAAVIMAAAMPNFAGCINQRKGVAPQVTKAQPAEGEAVAPSEDKGQPVKPVGVAAPRGKAPSPADRQDIGPIPKPSIADREKWSPHGFFTTPNELRICQLISSRNKEALTTLLDSGVELNTPGKFGFTVLYWAYVQDDMEAFELLLKHGADPDHRLTDTFRWSHDGPVESSKEPQLPHFIPFFGRDSILFTSLWQWRPEFCFAALKYTADVNQLDRVGENLMHRFLEPGLGYGSGVQALIDAGIDLNAKGQFGSTAAHMALDVDPSLCLRLLKAGADPSIKDDWGRDVAEVLEHRLSNSLTWQRTDVYNPLIKWFGVNYREIRCTKRPGVDAGADKGQNSAFVN